MNSGETLHERAAELLEGYVLGALDEAEAAVVDEHLEEGCEDCEEEVGILRRVAQSLPLASRLVSPSDALKGRVLAAVGPEAAGAAGMTRRGAAPRPIWLRSSRGRRLQALAASIGLVFLGGLLAWAVVLQNQVDELQEENRSLQSRMDDSVAAALFSVAGENSSSMQFVSLEEPQATARLLWDPDEGRFVLTAMGLDPTYEGSAYVAWVETDAGVVKLAHFYVGDAGMATLVGPTLVELEEVRGMKITHESDAESESPSRRVVLTLSR